MSSGGSSSASEQGEEVNEEDLERRRLLVEEEEEDEDEDEEGDEEPEADEEWRRWREQEERTLAKWCQREHERWRELEEKEEQLARQLEPKVLAERRDRWRKEAKRRKKEVKDTEHLLQRRKDFRDSPEKMAKLAHIRGEMRGKEEVRRRRWERKEWWRGMRTEERLEVWRTAEEERKRLAEHQWQQWQDRRTYEDVRGFFLTCRSLVLFVAPFDLLAFLPQSWSH